MPKSIKSAIRLHNFEILEYRAYHVTTGYFMVLCCIDTKRTSDVYGWNKDEVIDRICGLRAELAKLDADRAAFALAGRSTG